MRIFITVLFFAFILSGCTKEYTPAPGDNDIVYVCSGNAAETYHTFRECGRLKTCKQDILEVTRRKARENERIICITCKNKEDDEKKQKDSEK